jgi:uncharacterized protein YkwD
VSEATLAKAAEAERVARERRWAEAAQAYGRLSSGDGSARLREEWAERRDELARVAGLVEALTQRVSAGGEKAVRARLEAGTAEVLAADARTVRVKRGADDRTLAWGDLSPADALALLAPAKPSASERLAVATLAAELGDRKAAMDSLVPLAGDASVEGDVFRLVARRLEGRATVPAGGYRVMDGEFVDADEYARRTVAKEVAALRAEAAAIVERVAADPFFQRVAELKARRDELDRRRAHALLAIFDERHFPHPHDQPSIQTAYENVWGEIVKRTKVVEEAWDDAFAVKAAKSSPLPKWFERHAAIVAEVKAKGRDPKALVAAIEPYALYAGETTLSIRTFFRDRDEKYRLAYSRWVMDVYNPGQTAVATEPEREQVRITNEYRMMMGYALAVEPSGAPIESIDSKNAASILDGGRELRRVPLWALRIDDRLVRSARGHSLDMQKHGYFEHVAPSNSDFPGSAPWDRMGREGYQGAKSGENIARAGSPLAAHQGWLHSSGHHRGILDGGWSDMGTGVAGNHWTQNFAFGGGADRIIPGRPPETPADDAAPAGGDGAPESR